MSADRLQAVAERLERTLRDEEQCGHLAESLAVYEQLLAELSEMEGGPAVERTRAYAWMRAANVLGNLDRVEEAVRASQRALESASRSTDAIALGRAYLGHAAVEFAGGAVEQGARALHAAAEIFGRGDTPEHRQGLGWVHIIQAELRVYGHVPGEPEEIVTRADEALMLLRPYADWAGIDRAHAARAGAWATFGWREIWRRFERQGTLRDGRVLYPAFRRESLRRALFAITLPRAVAERLGPARTALAPFRDRLAFEADQCFHIPLASIGLVRPDAAAPGEIDPDDLRGVIADASDLLERYGPLHLTLANLNAFPESVFVEVHEATGRLSALQERLSHLRPDAVVGDEFLPHVKVATTTAGGPIPPAMMDVLRRYRRWKAGELEVDSLDVILLDRDSPIDSLDRLATIPLSSPA